MDMFLLCIGEFKFVHILSESLFGKMYVIKLLKIQTFNLPIAFLRIYPKKQPKISATFEYVIFLGTIIYKIESLESALSHMCMHARICVYCAVL